MLVLDSDTRYATDPATGERFDVESLHWRTGRGWEAFTRRANGYAGPTFYPDGLPPHDTTIQH